MTTDTAKIVLSAIYFKPSLLESHEDLTADLFAGKDKQAFLAISDLWADSRPASIDPAQLASKLGGDLTLVNRLMDGALACPSEAVFKAEVAELVRAGLRKEIIKRVDAGARSGDLDVSDIRPLLHKYEIAGDREKRLADDVRSWVDEANGEFSLAQLYSDLGVTSVNGKSSVRQVLARLVKEQALDYCSRRAGWYRRISKLASPIDLMATIAKPLDLYLPLGLGELVNIYPKSVVVCSGSSQLGKTAIALDMVKHNMRSHDVRYFFSEGGPEELRSRIEQHTDLTIPDWTMLAFEHSGHPADVVGPDAINVYDYLRVTGEGFFSVDDMLSDVHKKLKKGIAFINLQKSKNKELGDGAEFGLRIPRLYFTLNPDPDALNSKDKQSVIAKVQKAKGWKRPDCNPDGRIMPFTIRNGWQISYGTEWVYPEALVTARVKRYRNT